MKWLRKLLKIPPARVIPYTLDQNAGLVTNRATLRRIYAKRFDSMTPSAREG